MLSRVDVVEVVGRHVELKKAGINHKGLCPFHGEKSPSFIVSPSRQTYHCFGCGVHGDAIRFLTEHHGMSFVEAVQDLAQQTGLQVPEDERSEADRAAAAEQRQRQTTLTDVLAKAAQHYRQQLKSSPRAIDYLKRRGLTGEVAQRFGLGYAPEGWRPLASAFPRYDDPLLAESGMVIVQGADEGKSEADQKRYDRFRDRIMFPIRNVKGETIAFGGRVLDKGEPKYLNSPETPVFVKGRELYGLYESRTGLREKGYALVTEGYMDVVALAQLGFPNAVATLGTACTAEHVHKLLRFTEQVVFSFDGDAAGRRAAGRALEAALPHATDTRSFRFLFLPAEHDPDSYVRAHGQQAFEAQVRDAVPLSRQLLEHAAIDCALDTAEGRARMLAQARPLWQALPDGALKLQLLSELARQGGLPAEELSGLWGQGQGSSRGRSSNAQSSSGSPAEVDDPFDDGTPPGERYASRSKYGSGEPAWRKRPFNRDRTGQAEGPPAVRGRRPAPKRPEDRVLQMLFGQPQWWDSLPGNEHDFLHALPAPHGELIAWLERDLAEHGPRSWAVLREALATDEALPEASRQLADGDADPGATLDDFRRALDVLLERDLAQQMKQLLAQAGADPAALQQYRELDRQWREVKRRQAAAPKDET
ncbi:MAG TPA: DNA primase [Ideonella sp.]|uniref:DNA primase n=1 Tax=Ideonella sp. TaxID=1929293 RepID=UPI002C936F79|nr:DNA primase [Ideonella sp.]HSI49510.1 DNA primase [Ideonella sp.]